jgi:hypothetical protein
MPVSGGENMARAAEGQLPYETKGWPFIVQSHVSKR